MHGYRQYAQYRVTQVSCVARIDANSQIFAILRLRLGALLDLETRKRKKKESKPKRIVTRSAGSPKLQTGRPPSLSSTEDSVPALSMNNEVKLVSCPIKSIDADESAFGWVQSLDLVLALDLIPDFPSLYEDSSLLDHLDLGEVPTTSHPSRDILGY